MIAPDQLEELIKDYSSLSRVLIGLGFDAVRGVKALLATFHSTLTLEEQDAILNAIKSDARVQRQQALEAAGDAPTA